MADSQNHTNQSESKPFDHEVLNRLAAGLGDHADNIDNITAHQLKKISAPASGIVSEHELAGYYI